MPDRCRQKIEPFRPSAVAVIDIGSPANVGWCLLPDGLAIHDLGDLAGRIAKALETGPCAVGFEAPMYVPYREDFRSLNKARGGERNRAWSASAGATVLAQALVVVPYFLRLLCDQAPQAQCFLDWLAMPHRPQCILFFEAFVSGRTKGNPAQIKGIHTTRTPGQLRSHFLQRAPTCRTRTHSTASRASSSSARRLCARGGPTTRGFWRKTVW